VRQVLIKLNSQVKALSSDKFEFCLDKSRHNLDFEPGKVTPAKFPFEIKVLSGGKIDLNFTLNAKLAEAGVMLLGAYRENNIVSATFMNLGDEILSIEDGYPVLEGQLMETVTYRQIEEGNIGDVQVVGSDGNALVVNKPQKTKKNKKGVK
jgi:hypothetical protein